MHPHGPIQVGLTGSQAEAAKHNEATLVLGRCRRGKDPHLSLRCCFADHAPGILDQHRAIGLHHAQVEPGLEQRAGLRFTGDLGAMELLRQFWRKAVLTKAGKQEKRINLLHYVILGDSLAQGVALLRPDCLSDTRVGTSSARYVSGHVVKVTAQAALLSLGINDGPPTVETVKKLVELRDGIRRQ